MRAALAYTLTALIIVATPLTFAYLNPNDQHHDLYIGLGLSAGIIAFLTAAYTARRPRKPPTIPQPRTGPDDHT